jgi:protein involved in polysaccharide export with SLBB domain
MPRDRITVFGLSSTRDHVMQPILDELRLEGTSNQPSQVVQVSGHVKVPGSYPLEPGMTVSDLVRAGGGAADEAYQSEAELVRYEVLKGEVRRPSSSRSISARRCAAIRPPATAAFDALSVKQVPDWASQESVTLRGGALPGSYPSAAARRSSVISRAGGLTAYAFPEGSVFTREDLRVREQEQLDMLNDRMERDVTLLALQSAAAGRQAAARPVGRSSRRWCSLRTSARRSGVW